MSTLSPTACWLKKLAVFVLFVAALTVLAQTTPAQNVTASPVELTFGIPTIIPTPTFPPAPTSAAAPVSVAVTGASSASPVTFGTVSSSNPKDFQISGDKCSGTTVTSSTTIYCQVSVTFSDSLAPATTLETATLTIPYSIGGTEGDPATLTVPMNGAYGAIKLFDETVEGLSASGASFTNQTQIGFYPLFLSCPTSPITATLSNTPDGNGYVFVDNYLSMAVGGVPVTNPIEGGTAYSPAGNVCTGGVTDSFGGTVQQDCFSAAYRAAAITNVLNGDYADTFTNPNNNVLPPGGGNGPAGGVMPINVSSFLTETTTTPLQVSFTLLDAGGWVGSSSLFLATNCTQAGIAPGAIITGTAATTNTFNLDTSANQRVVEVDNTSNNPPPAGTITVLQDIQVPQQLFYQLVSGTSAGPAVCMRVSAELDYSVTPPAPMCKGYQIQCQYTNPTTGVTTTSGANCDPASLGPTVRNLYDQILFDSPDGPSNGHNYLYGPVGTPAADACSNVVPGGACAVLTGPGMLMGGDEWLTCEAGMACGPLLPNTTSSATETWYSASNCTLTGVLTGDTCPLNTLTAFYGAVDPGPVGGSAKNSILIPVVNMPLPYGLAFINGLDNGWVATLTPQVSFVASPALYVKFPNNPSANNFKPAPLYSVTFGTTVAPGPLPDTTSPIPTDSILYNTGATPGFGAPLCVSTPSGPFAPTGNIPNPTGTSGLTNGTLYNLHFFVTDCALSEGLLFLPTGTQLTNPNANWASFEYVTFGVDTSAPSLTVTPPATVTYTHNTPGPIVSFMCSTSGASGLQNCGTSLGKNLPATGYPAVGLSTYSSSVTLPTTTKGKYTVIFYARSEAGVQATPFSWTYTVD
jgi:hypothetical protein